MFLEMVSNVAFSICCQVKRQAESKAVSTWHGPMQLLKRNPLERISFEEFFDHPFLLPLGSGSSPPSPQSSTVALSHPGLAASPTTLMDSAQPLQDRQGSIGSGPPRHPGQAQVGAALRGPWDAQSGEQSLC